MRSIPALWLSLSILVLVRRSSCFAVVIHSKTCYVKPFAPPAFQRASSLLRLHPPQPCTSLLSTSRVLRLCLFDSYCMVVSRVPLQRLCTVPAASMTNDCTDGDSGFLCTFPLPLTCAVIVIVLVKFSTFHQRFTFVQLLCTHLKGSSPPLLPVRSIPPALAESTAGWFDTCS